MTVAPSRTAAQVGCLPFEEPCPDVPPAGAPELRALIDERYQAHVPGAETCLDGLNDEVIRARAQFRTVLDRHPRFSGDEAGIELEAPVRSTAGRVLGCSSPRGKQAARAVVAASPDPKPTAGRGGHASVLVAMACPSRNSSQCAISTP